MELRTNPLEQFLFEFEKAEKIGNPFADAMALATVDKEGLPKNRMVLYKGVHDGGLLFFTNYESDKGHELVQKPFVSCLFHWAQTKTQVRVRGSVETAPAEVSDKYFATRPRESQLGAWASQQSRELSSTEELHQNFQHWSQEFEGKDVTRPPYWGGYTIQPTEFEFWYERPGRLHDRFFFKKQGDEWIKSLKSP